MGRHPKTFTGADIALVAGRREGKSGNPAKAMGGLVNGAFGRLCQPF
jgi:hypothetical protein